MKRLLIILFILIVLLVSAGIVYLNNVFLPQKLKSYIIRSLSSATQKQVSLSSVRFTILKGLVIKELVIADKGKTIISVQESSCSVLLLPLFKKKIIIPSIKISSADVFVERNKDASLNLQDLVTSASGRVSPSGFGVLIRKITLINSKVRFQDNSLTLPFTKIFDQINARAFFTLPGKIKFDGRLETGKTSKLKISLDGEYQLFTKQLDAKVYVRDLAIKEFLPYYEQTGIRIPEGLVDAFLHLKTKDGLLTISLATTQKQLLITKDKISAEVNAQVNAQAVYSFEEKHINFSGRASLSDSSVSNLESIGDIRQLNGEITFNNNGAYAQSLRARVWDTPLEVKATLRDFKNPFLVADMHANLALEALADILKDKFNFSIPAQVKGKGTIFVTLRTKLPFDASRAEVSGYFDVLNAVVTEKKMRSSFEDIHGRVNFSPTKLSWSELQVKFLGLPYAVSGELLDFNAPKISVRVSSDDLSFKCKLSFQDTSITFSQLSGRYLNSEFSLSGVINTSMPPHLVTQARGELGIYLQDAPQLLKRFRPQLAKINPEGVVRAHFTLKGDVTHVKSCVINAKLSSPSLSLYGLKGKDFAMEYSQSQEVADIKLMPLSCYDGTLEASSRINLKAPGFAYWLVADVKDLKLEQLKMDTQAKNSTLAGVLKAGLRLNGFLRGASKLNGGGNIFITDGNLWQLNLFKGMGALLFSRDFASIVFKEASCDFTVQDTYILSDNVVLKSDITDLSGEAALSLDGLIDASLNVHVLDEMAPLTGTFKDITTAIVGKSGKFGVIKITGTLKEPKYKFQSAVAGLFKDLKKSLLGN